MVWNWLWRDTSWRAEDTSSTAKQFAMRVEHRARRTGQAGVTAAKVLVLMDGQRLTLDQAGADAIGALPASLQSAPSHSPARSKILRSPGAVTQLRITPRASVSSTAWPAPDKLLMQAVHLVAGDVQDLLQTLAALQHTPMFKHGGRHGLGRVEVIVLKAAQP